MKLTPSALPTCLSITLALCSHATLAGDPGETCQPAGEYAYVCGPQSAEDLVLVPGTTFIIASNFSSGAPFYLIDAQSKSWSELRPTAKSTSAVHPDYVRVCPGPPDFKQLVTHGLHLRAGAAGRSTLYAVGHGAREAIEVFDVDANGERPVVRWKGCALTPQGMEANSVTSLPGGSLLATVPLQHGKTLTDAMNGETTGAVYAWSPGDGGFTKVQGTELPYANGIEASADGGEFYVASSGAMTITAYANTNPARVLRTTATLPIVPDNLHMDGSGKLVTAGLVTDDARCGVIAEAEGFVLEEFAACPRPFLVIEADPRTLSTEVIARGPASEQFSNITMALRVGKELWIGTFGGDRVAYRLMQ